MRKVFNLFGNANQSQIEKQVEILNAKNKKGNTALHKAAKANNFALVKDLLTHPSLEIDERNKEDETALMIAAGKADVKVLELLVEHGSSVNHITSDGYTPLCEAINNSRYDNLCFLLEHGADVDNISGVHPLHLAAKLNARDMVKKLIEYNANVNLKDSFGLTPLTYVADNGTLDLLPVLKEAGAKFIGDKISVNRALMNNYPDMVKALIDYGCDPSVQVQIENDNKFTSFSLKLSYSNMAARDKTKLLTDGDTALHYAVKAKNLALAESCLKACPTLILVANDKGKTPAHLAVYFLEQEMAQCLSKYSDTKAFAKIPFYIEAGNKGFASIADVNAFFKDPNYQLSPEQQEIKKSIEPKRRSDYRAYLTLHKSVVPTATSNDDSAPENVVKLKV